MKPEVISVVIVDELSDVVAIYEFHHSDDPAYEDVKKAIEQYKNGELNARDFNEFMLKSYDPIITYGCRPTITVIIYSL